MSPNTTALRRPATAERGVRARRSLPAGLVMMLVAAMLGSPMAGAPAVASSPHATGVEPTRILDNGFLRFGGSPRRPVLRTRSSPTTARGILTTRPANASRCALMDG
jgi:hypothetical protein